MNPDVFKRSVPAPPATPAQTMSLLGRQLADLETQRQAKLLEAQEAEKQVERLSDAADALLGAGENVRRRLSEVMVGAGHQKIMVGDYIFTCSGPTSVTMTRVPFNPEAE